METLDTAQISSFSVFQERSLNIGLIEVSVCHGFGLDQESIIHIGKDTKDLMFDTKFEQNIVFKALKFQHFATHSKLRLHSRHVT